MEVPEKIEDQIINNNSLLQETERRKDLQVEKIANIKKNKKEAIMQAILYGSICLFGTSLGIFTISMLQSVGPLQILYTLIMAGVTTGVVFEPLKSLIGSKKRLNKATEVKIALDNQIEKLKVKKEILEKKLINNSMTSSSTTFTNIPTKQKDNLITLSNYERAIAFFGGNKEKFLKLYREGCLQSYLKQKGIQDRDIYYIKYHISEDDATPIREVETIFDVGPVLTKKY